MSDNPNKSILAVVIALVIILLLLLANAGSCSRTGGMGAVGGAGAAPAPSAAGNAGTVSAPGAAGSAGTAPAANPAATSPSAGSPTDGSASPSGNAPSSASSQQQGNNAVTTPTQSNSSTALDPLTGSTEVAMSLVYDTSGSMGTPSALPGLTRLESAQKQSDDFVSSVSSQVADGTLTAKLGVAQFATDASTVCALTSDMSAVRQGIASLSAAGMTDMYEGLEQGMSQLSSANGQKLMVFLSDGMNTSGHDEAAVLDLANKAASEGIKIYTIGFGPSNTIDENLLGQIASATGGKYAHEDSSSLSSAAVGLYGTMMNAQLGNSQQLLLGQTGTVQQGQTAQVGTFNVNQNGTMQAILYWPGSALDMQLTDPDGILVDSGYAGYSIDSSTIPTRIKIENAKQGTWNMAVYGQQTSMADEPFYAAAALGNVQQEPSTPAVVTTAPKVGTSSGAVNNNGEVIMFLLVIVMVACLGGVYAFTKRNGEDERK